MTLCEKGQSFEAYSLKHELNSSSPSLFNFTAHNFPRIINFSSSNRPINSSSIPLKERGKKWFVDVTVDRDSPYRVPPRVRTFHGQCEHPSLINFFVSMFHSRIKETRKSSVVR
ncbi:hypothetical protein TNIN_406921 [Trichonephila inaurata madagascariensis]|uniref:Uncharacterized protein n=1 Tax=Trichonephila inaurata madagascariensis TaxID=2747483 RepID=A0A8X6XD53_9ARAC|nr:hypothetical protein TNIN_406921 [Trichonephila inaurata madagascariensis]